MNKLYIVIVFLGLTYQSIAQPYATTPYKYLIEAAEESLEYNDYYNALEWYGKAYKESKDKDIKAKIANLQFLMRNYSRASKSFDRLLRKDKDSLYQEHRLTYAKSLRGEGDYVEAMNQYQMYIDYTDDEMDKAEAMKDLQGIKDMGGYDDNVETVITFPESGINSAFTEYGPVEHPDGSLYFSSFQRRKEIVLDGEEKDYHAKIYVSKKSDDGTYGKPDALNSHINREDFNTGNPCFSKDGRIMYFTRTVLDRNELIESRLYVSYREDDDWAPPVEAVGINGEYMVRHPSVGELYGRNVLFFSANIPGGHGGYDIYYANFKGDDSFELPINLGESINTEKDELTPFYKDGDLYFSSDGLLGMGGHDIYHTTWDGSQWSKVVNLGHQYNSPNDDLYFNISPTGTNGSLVSNRPHEKKKKLKSETCCDDIYLFSISDIVIDLIATVDGNDGPLSGATAILIDLSAPDDESFRSKSSPTDNKFSFLLEGDHNYILKFKHPEYTTDSLFFNTSGIYDDYTVNKSLTLSSKPISFVTDKPEIEILKKNVPIRLHNIYYDFDDATILRDAEKDLSTLVKLMNEYPDLVIELGSHTDSQGSDSYNAKLSKRRAESARQWMLRKGIAQHRVQSKGYGESVIINHCVNGVKCTDEQHRQNRRTEFKIIGGPETIVITKEVVKKKPTRTSTPTPKTKIEKETDTSKEIDTNKEIDTKKEAVKETKTTPKIDSEKLKEEVRKNKKKRVVKKKRKRRKIKSKFKKKQ